MDINEYLDKYEEFEMAFSKTGDLDFDYEITFSTRDNKNRHRCYETSIVYKKDDEFEIKELISKILDEFDEKLKEEKEQ